MSFPFVFEAMHLEAFLLITKAHTSRNSTSPVCMLPISGQNNVVEAHGLVRTNGGAFAMVMPYFEHGEFKDYMKTLTLSGIAAYMRSLLTALTHVHDQGVIHRDIKPRNFMYSVERQQGG